MLGVDLAGATRPLDHGDASPPAARRCLWCSSALQKRRGTTYCGVKCRQSSWRLRERSPVARIPTTPPGLRPLPEDALRALRPLHLPGALGLMLGVDLAGATRPLDHGDASPPAARRCLWCSSALQKRRGTTYCGAKCRQSSWRLRERSPVARIPTTPPGLSFAYADPPYPGKAHLYSDQPTYAGEVDHASLVHDLRERFPDGWALSTSADALRDVLALTPLETRVCPWVKPLPVHPDQEGLLHRHEYVLVYGGRVQRPAVVDWLWAAPAHLGGSDLVGRKPIAFNAWLFSLLGMVPGDTLADLFPGTGQVGRSWDALSVGARGATRRGQP